MYEQSTNSKPEAAEVDDVRDWSRQLRRDRRAALSTMEENAALPGPGAAAAATTARGGAAPRGRFGNFIRGATLSGMTAAGLYGGAPSAEGSRDDGQDERADDAGGLGGDQMESADDAGAGGKQGARRPSGPVTGAAVKEAVKKAKEGAQGGKEKLAAKAAAMATKVLGEDKVADLANAVLREFFDPLGRRFYWAPMIWMYATFFLGAFIVLPLHWVYMFLGWLGIPKFHASTLKSFLFIINNCIFLVIILVLLAIIYGIVKSVACSHNVFCVIGLIRDYGSYFF